MYICAHSNELKEEVYLFIRLQEQEKDYKGSKGTDQDTKI